MRLWAFAEEINFVSNVISLGARVRDGVEMNEL